MITIKLRRDVAYKWALANPVLAEGEPGFENDTGKFKIGDGEARWVDLEYFSPGTVAVTDGGHTSDAALLAHINALMPHSAYDDGPSLFLLYQNAKV